MTFLYTLHFHFFVSISLSYIAPSLTSLFRTDQNEPGGPLAGPPTSNPEYMPRKFALACLTGNLADVEQYLQVAVVARGLKSVEIFLVRLKRVQMF